MSRPKRIYSTPGDRPATGHHSVFDCHYHLVLVTKYRHKCLTEIMRSRAGEIVRSMLPPMCALEACKGEEDHLHLLLSIPPHIPLSKVVNSLKTVTARLLRKEYASHLKPFYWKPYLWSRSYFIATTGGAALDVVRRYVESQGSKGAPRRA